MSSFNMTTMRSAFTAAFLFAFLHAPWRASAQPATAQAEVLFRDGKRLMQEGNITAACEAFEGSYKKDPAVTTLMNLADCREKNQQYASAWAHFVEVARQSSRDLALSNLTATARDRSAALEAKLSFLIINVPDDARAEGLVITRNGVAVDAVEWNRDIPVDGGTYVIEGKAPAYEPWSTKVTVGNAKDKQSVNVPRFHEALASASTEPVDAQSSGLSGKRKLALGLGAVGVVAIGGGVALELKSGSTYDDAKTSPTAEERHELTDQATRERRIGAAATAVGALAVGAGVYLWLSGKSERTGIALVPELDFERVGFHVTAAF